MSNTLKFQDLGKAYIYDILTELLSLQALNSNQPCEVLSTGNKFSKRKRARHPDAVSRIDLESILNKVDIRTLRDNVPAIPASNSIIASFDALKNLTDLPDHARAPPTPAIVSAATRALECLEILLQSLLPPNHCSPTSTEMLSNVSTLMSFLITTVIPVCIPSKSKDTHTASTQRLSAITSVDRIVGNLTDMLLIPLIRSFRPLSQSFTTKLFTSKQAADQHAVDLRADICCLLRKAMSELDALSGLATENLADSFHSVKQRVALESVREIERVFRRNPAGNNTPELLTPKKLSHVCRIEKLVEKETLWYLCGILHSIFDSSPFTGPGDNNISSARNFLLEEAIMTGLYNFLRRDYTYLRNAKPPRSVENAGVNEGTANPSINDTQNGILRANCSIAQVFDEVAQGMVLNLVERLCFRQPQVCIDGSV